MLLQNQFFKLYLFLTNTNLQVISRKNQGNDLKLYYRVNELKMILSIVSRAKQQSKFT